MDSGADAKVVSQLQSASQPSIMEKAELTPFEQQELKLQLLALVGETSASELRDGGPVLPKVNYKNVEFIPTGGTVVKGVRGDLKKSGNSFGWKTQAYAPRLPRLFSRFPFISNVASKITSMKKRYRMKKLLNRTPRMPKPVGGPLFKQGQAAMRPVAPAKIRFTVPKAAKVTMPKFPSPPKPAAVPKVKTFVPRPAKSVYRAPRIGKSAATVRTQSGTLLKALSPRAILNGEE